jgi:hypothetical protein
MHTTQGAEAGEDKAIKAIVLSPGTDAFEGINPGTLYTGISRASTLGNGDIEKSSLYFCGSMATKDRFTNVKCKKNSKNVKYKRVIQREAWIAHLRKNINNKIFTETEKNALKTWINQTTITKQELDTIILYHATKKSIN